MGKIRTRTLGLEEVEEKQKKAQKNRSEEKKSKKLRKDDKEPVAEAPEKIDVKKQKEQKSKSGKTADTKSVKKTADKEEKKQAKNPRGKKYLQAAKKIDSKKTLTLSEAVKLLKKIKYANFDESVEIHMNLDDQGLRGEVDLPHSIGKTARVKIVDDSVIEAIEKGIIDFDILISHPSYMPKLVKFAKILGPRGLMPNPKTGTVSTNPDETLKKLTKGLIRWKSEAKFPLLHQLIGKISYPEENIEENARLFILSVGKIHIKKLFLKTTMSPSLRLDIESI